MRCAKCVERGKPHRVYEGGSTTTLMATLPGYWDENGAYHQPTDPNTTTTMYHCSCGHSWKTEHAHWK